MFVDVVNHMACFPNISKSTAYRELQVMRSAYGWQHRKLPTVYEYCDYFDLTILYYSKVTKEEIPDIPNIPNIIT